MYVTYFDEIKADIRNGQPRYIIGGLMVPIDRIGEIEGQLNEYSEEIFGSPKLTTTTEFHGNFIYNGKGPFRGLKAKQRIEILAHLGQIISEETSMKRVYAAILSTELYNPEHAAEYAFAHFVERTQRLAKRHGNTILIGDRDDQQSVKMIDEFYRYRTLGTPWIHGIEVKHVVDAVHFARSHHSRLIQLADIYLFLAAHRWGTRKGWMASQLSAALKDVDIFPNAYKEWPAKVE